MCITHLYVYLIIRIRLLKTRTIRRQASSVDVRSCICFARAHAPNVRQSAFVLTSVGRRERDRQPGRSTSSPSPLYKRARYRLR